MFLILEVSTKQEWKYWTNNHEQEGHNSKY